MTLKAFEITPAVTDFLLFPGYSHIVVHCTQRRFTFHRAKFDTHMFNSNKVNFDFDLKSGK